MKQKDNKIKDVDAELVADQIADLRAKEQAELDGKIKNADKYRGADGRVDRDKLTNDADRAAYDEVYDKFNKPISDLIAQQEKEEGKQQTNDSENKPRVSGEVGVGQESVQAKPVEGGGATQTQAGGNVQGNEKKVSPFTAFQTKGEAGRKAREALKEEVGPEEFRRMDNIHRNGEKMLKEMQAKGILEIRCP